MKMVVVSGKSVHFYVNAIYSDASEDLGWQPISRYSDKQNLRGCSRKGVILNTTENGTPKRFGGY